MSANGIYTPKTQFMGKWWKTPWKRGFPLFRQTQIWIPAELQTISTFLYICGLFCYTYISVKVWLLHLWNLALNFKSGFALSCRSSNCWVANVSFSPRQVPSRNGSPKRTGHPKNSKASNTDNGGHLWFWSQFWPRCFAGEVTRFSQFFLLESPSFHM